MTAKTSIFNILVDKAMDSRGLSEAQARKQVVAQAKYWRYIMEPNRKIVRERVLHEGRVLRQDEKAIGTMAEAKRGGWF